MSENLKFFLICIGFVPIAWLLLAGSVVTYAIFADWLEVRRWRKEAEQRHAATCPGCPSCLPSTYGPPQ